MARRETNWQEHDAALAKELKERLDRYLTDYGIADSTFGRQFCNDNKFYMRFGKNRLQRKTMLKLKVFLDEAEKRPKECPLDLHPIQVKTITRERPTRAKTRSPEYIALKRAAKDLVRAYDEEDIDLLDRALKRVRRLTS